MTEKKRTSSRLQRAARERMKVTGEKYTAALMAVTEDAGSQTELSSPPTTPAGSHRSSTPRAGRPPPPICSTRTKRHWRAGTR